MTDNSNTRPRPRRRIMKPRQYDTSVASPCVKVCQFQGEEFCVGCRRTQDEIREWMIMTREQKLEVLKKIKTRSKPTS